MSVTSAAAILPTYDLSSADAAYITRLLESPEGKALKEGRARSLVRQLPKGLLDFLDEFQLAETSGGIKINGFPVSSEIGPTPGNWRDAARLTSAFVYERYLVLLASALGEVFSFRSLQEGRLVQDLMPIPGQEDEKSGNSSRSLLDLHTEDAFHPNRCDYLGLLCMRNIDLIPTTYAELDPSAIPSDMLEVLFQPRFTIRPDATHGLAGKSEPIALLWGARTRPYLRVDDSFTEPLPHDAVAEDALADLLAALAKAERTITLSPGEVLFIDNHLAVHGRHPFKARYDGMDRWLKRVNVTRDFRRSRALRDSPSSRLLCGLASIFRGRAPRERWQRTAGGKTDGTVTVVRRAGWRYVRTVMKPGWDGGGGDVVAAGIAGRRTLGSAYDEAELEAMKAAALQWTAVGQLEFDLRLEPGGRVGGPLPIRSSRMRHLLDAHRARLQSA